MPSPPKRIQRDSLAWRKQTDLILAFVSEELVFQPGSLVLASELLDRFTTWLVQNGHHEWSAQTFAARFAEHSTISEHAVKKMRKRIDGLTLSRPNTTGPHLLSNSPATGNLHVWSGLAWR
jgi:phage/plasmid-associated DNA primase